jgi:hypothetical protein
LGAAGTCRGGSGLGVEDISFYDTSTRAGSLDGGEVEAFVSGNFLGRGERL